MTIAHDGQIEGRTFAQKLVYFLINIYEMPLVEKPHFKAGLYGPYSEEVASELSKLVALDFLDEKIYRTSKGNLMYIYSLNEDGKKIIEKIIKEHSKVYSLIRRFLNKLKDIKTEDLIIASKVHYIIEEDPQLIEDQVKLISKAENYGWDIKPEEINRCLEILKVIKNERKT